MLQSGNGYYYVRLEFNGSFIIYYYKQIVPFPVYYWAVLTVMKHFVNDTY